MLLALLTIVAASLFTGAAFYITLVEHPARMALPSSGMLVQWRSSYERAIRWQGGLAILGGVLGLAAWLAGMAWPLLAAGVLMLSNWPYTLAVVMPVNRALMACGADAEPRTAETLLARWARAHVWRGVLGGLAIALAVVGTL